MALNVFFRENESISTNLSQLQLEDFHCKNTARPIEITVIFDDLSEAAREDFSNYVRQGQLVIKAVANYNRDSGRAEVKQHGQRLGIRAFIPFFEAESSRAKVIKLKQIYNEIRNRYTDLREPSNRENMISALRKYEEARPEQCELIPSEDQFYGFSKGANRLARHVQWVYVPAVKDASSEQAEARNSALGRLLTRTVRSKVNFDEIIQTLRADVQQKYQKLLDDNQNVLDEISTSLKTRISEWAHPKAHLRLQWKQDPDKSVRVEEPLAHILAGEGKFQGELARFGHGFQRSYLLALLQELSGTDDTSGPTLILACEEPELYQHPPQARHLATVLNSLSQCNAQVIISTHDPRFVSSQRFEDVRMVRKHPKNQNSAVSQVTLDEIAQAIANATEKPPAMPKGILLRIHQALQLDLSEMFFTSNLILVEGLEDVAYLMSCIQLMDKMDAFQRLGCHIVPANGKSQLLQPLVIARKMGISTYVVFDADADKPDMNGSKAKHERDNRALLKLLDSSANEVAPAETKHGRGFTMWHSDIESVVKTDVGEDRWTACRQQADEEYGHVGHVRKHSLHIGASLAFAWQYGNKPAGLLRVCEAILDPTSYVP